VLVEHGGDIIRALLEDYEGISLGLHGADVRFGEPCPVTVAQAASEAAIQKKPLKFGGLR
jgi:hypothetical protein